jgi:hypothetical protein
MNGALVDQNNPQTWKGVVLNLSLKTAPFPDSLRRNGHTYSGKHFNFKEHYNDSSVRVFIPDYYKPTAKTDVVVHFHGWYNNLDSAIAYFKLCEQFYAARRNAILIVPQGPKNAPDSYGGKLEKPEGFKHFIEEVLEKTRQNSDLQKDFPKNTPSVKIGKIVLSGHSGGYRVISQVLLHGGLPIHEVLLFDGLYGQLEKYGHWLTHTRGRFVHIYTNDGGTKQETENFRDDLKAWQVPFAAVEAAQCTPALLKHNRIVLIHTPLTHNEVVHVGSNFQTYLETSGVLKPRF